MNSVYYVMQKVFERWVPAAHLATNKQNKNDNISQSKIKINLNMLIKENLVLYFSKCNIFNKIGPFKEKDSK